MNDDGICFDFLYARSLSTRGFYGSLAIAGPQVTPKEIESSDKICDVGAKHKISFSNLLYSSGDNSQRKIGYAEYFSLRD